MNVSGLNDFFSPGATGTDRALLLRTDNEFNLTLKLGQVLKGKVLRHYEGGRYAMSFGGQEKVVDSAVPLRVGNTIQARVIAIEDKVHLQRLGDSARGEDSKSETPAQLRDDISALFARHQVQLTQTQHQSLTRLARRLGGSTLVASSALIVHKLGLPLEPELLQAVYRVLDSSRATQFVNTEFGPQLPTGNETGTVNIAVVQQLAPLLAELSDDVANVATKLAFDNGARSDSSTDQRQGARDAEMWQLGQWLVNMQGQGSLAHRYLRFPLWFDERMIEVSMALYSQHDRQEGTAEPGALRYHKAVFSLETENLGQVEIEALVADRHLRLTVNVRRQYAAERLAEYLTTLTAALNAHDWQVDEIRYGIRDDVSGVLQSIVEHHVTPDSLSQLM